MQRHVIDFPHRKAGHCATGSLRDLLDFHELTIGLAPLAEGPVFGLGGGLAFAYLELPGMNPPLYLVGRGAGLEATACRNLGITAELRQTEDGQEGWEWVRAAIARGEPTMVWADVKHLDYLRVRMHNTMHAIVITGYDEVLGVAYVADNDRSEIQPCAFDSLARARNSDAFPAPNRHATWFMQFPQQLPAAESMIAAGVSDAVRNMRAPGDGISPGGYAGLSGLEAFAAAYATWPERFNDDLDSAMWGLGVFITKAGTGGALFRSLHAEFLLWAGEVLGARALNAAGSHYGYVAALWRALAEAPHGRGHPIAREIVRAETEGVRMQEAWLETNSCGY